VLPLRWRYIVLVLTAAVQIIKPNVQRLVIIIRKHRQWKLSSDIISICITSNFMSTASSQEQKNMAVRHRTGKPLVNYTIMSGRLHLFGHTAHANPSPSDQPSTVPQLSGIDEEVDLDRPDFIGMNMTSIDAILALIQRGNARRTDHWWWWWWTLLLTILFVPGVSKKVASPTKTFRNIPKSFRGGQLFLKHPVQ